MPRSDHDTERSPPRHASRGAPARTDEGERHYLERELYQRFRASDELFDFLQQGSLDGIWLWDVERPENEWYSPRFWELLGYDPKEKEHSSAEWQKLIHPDDLQVALDNFAAHCADPHHPYDQYVRYFHKDGSIVWVRCRGVAIRDAAGRAIRLLGAHTDVTALKRAEERVRLLLADLELRNKALEATNEELRRASQAKSDFVANMSHELRTPLNTIIGFAELLESGRLTPATDIQREYLSDILASGRQLLSLIESVLDLAKVEAGRLVLEPEPLRIRELLRESLDAVRAFAGERELVLDASPVVNEVVLDPVRLRQILANYLSNAVKFTSERGRITLRLAPEGEDHLRVSVTDDGIGIAEENLAKVFTRFEQVDTGPAKRHQGAGLGLALTKRIVEAQGGRVGVTSELGEGSTFYAVLPRELAGSRAGPASPR